MVNILGVSGLYHDSAAAVSSNGEVIAAAQEERFTRKKADASLPINAMKFCADKVGNCVDAVIYYDNPILTYHRWIENCKRVSPDNEKTIQKSFLSMFSEKLWVNKRIEQILQENQIQCKDGVFVCEHHISHAASAFYPSPYEEAAILTMDGVGEWATCTIGIGKGNKIEILQEMDYPDSVGLLYSAFTFFCGFKVNFGEYKLMGLAPYGKPIYTELIKDNIVTIFEDGSIKLNMEYFAFMKEPYMITAKFSELFKVKVRNPEDVISQVYMDIAASIQKVTEEIVLKLARTASKITGCENLTMAGGIALNCVANGRLLKENIFDRIWIQPAAGDAGGALGASLYAAYNYYGIERKVNSGKDMQKGTYLGPDYSNDNIEKYLKRNNYAYHYYENEELYKVIAKYIQDDKVIGLFHGKMEFGPRALGNRSIIASAISEKMQSKLNLKIKYRESFRPFAPSVLLNRVSDYFHLNQESPYMLLVADVKEELCCEQKEREDNCNMIDVINQKRSAIPAVTHVDYSARIQTVTKDTNEYYYGIIKEYENLTKEGVIVNTSFNVRGEPIVCSPLDAYLCFMRTEMDILVLENCVLLKEEQEELKENKDWRELYELD